MDIDKFLEIVEKMFNGLGKAFVKQMLNKMVQEKGFKNYEEFKSYVEKHGNEEAKAKLKEIDKKLKDLF
ncbi:hypothetical protein [Desulfurobacterium sp.]